MVAAPDLPAVAAAAQPTWAAVAALRWHAAMPGLAAGAARLWRGQPALAISPAPAAAERKPILLREAISLPTDLFVTTITTVSATSAAAPASLPSAGRSMTTTITMLMVAGSGGWFRRRSAGAGVWSMSATIDCGQRSN